MKRPQDNDRNSKPKSQHADSAQEAVKPVTAASSSAKAAAQSARPPFLVLAPICVLLGLALAIHNGLEINIFNAVLAFIGALFAHISVNALNEFHDFKTGLDLNTQRTPFSGGSGALPSNPLASNAVLALGVSTLILTALIGCYFITTIGWQIAPVGLLGLTLIAAYTLWLNRHPILCLLAPGAGFGVAIVVGTYIVSTGDTAQLPWLALLLAFSFSNNLLLLNQYPDVAPDKEAKRNTFPIAFGAKTSNIVMTIFFAIGYLIIVYLVMNGTFPLTALASLTTLPLALFTLTVASKLGLGISESNLGLKAMTCNVVVAVVSPLLLAVSLIVSAN